MDHVHNFFPIFKSKQDIETRAVGEPYFFTEWKNLWNCRNGGHVNLALTLWKSRNIGYIDQTQIYCKSQHLQQYRLNSNINTHFFISHTFVVGPKWREIWKNVCLCWNWVCTAINFVIYSDFVFDQYNQYLVISTKWGLSSRVHRSYNFKDFSNPKKNSVSPTAQVFISCSFLKIGPKLWTWSKKQGFDS